MLLDPSAQPNEPFQREKSAVRGFSFVLKQDDDAVFPGR